MNIVHDWNGVDSWFDSLSHQPNVISCFSDKHMTLLVGLSHDSMPKVRDRSICVLMLQCTYTIYTIHIRVHYSCSRN